MTPIIIIGCGATTLLLLLLFSKESIPPQDITIIDPFFNGGDLQRSWASIRSNTHWSKLCEAIESLSPECKPKQSSWKSNETVPLSILIQTLRESTESYLFKCNLIFDRAIYASCTEKTWEVKTETSQAFTGNLLFMCSGSEPKTLPIPIPTIPLHHALCPVSLGNYIQPHHHVLLFGSQHSGTLVIDSLTKVNCKKIYVVHRHENPFSFARDGEYDGIKEEAEEIATRILAEKPSHIELIRDSNLQKLAVALRSADWVIYAIGFQRRNECRIYSNGSPINLDEYNPLTGKLPSPAESAWGFGIAFPSRAPDGKHYDVSLHSFAQHIRNQKNEILETYSLATSGKITNT
jgi:hypothetical protein